MKRNFLVSILLKLLLLIQLSGCSNEAASFQQTDSAVTEVGEALTFVFDSKEYDLPVNQIQGLQNYLNEYTPKSRRLKWNESWLSHSGLEKMDCLPMWPTPAAPNYAVMFWSTCKTTMSKVFR